MGEDVRDLAELVDMIKHHFKDCKKKDNKKEEEQECESKCNNVNQNGASNQNNVNIEPGQA